MLIKTSHFSAVQNVAHGRLVSNEMKTIMNERETSGLIAWATADVSCRAISVRDGQVGQGQDLLQVTVADLVASVLNGRRSMPLERRTGMA